MARERRKERERTHAMMESAYNRPTLEPDWEEARRFHGHLGPWLALGMKIGQEAMRLLNARPHFGVTVRAGCPLAPPASCLLDGLQWMTGATYGKRNLVAEASETVWVEVANTRTGESVRFVLREGVPSHLAQQLQTVGDEAASRALFSQPVEEFAEVSRRGGDCEDHSA